MQRQRIFAVMQSCCTIVCLLIGTIVSRSVIQVDGF